MHFLVLIAIQFCISQTCDIQPDTAYPLDTVRQCLHSVKLDKDIAQRTIESVLGWLENHAYNEYYQSPIEPWTEYGFDAIGEIKSINIDEINSEYELIMKIHKILNKFRDGHIMFLTQCTWNLEWYLPYHFVAFQKTPDDTTPSFYLESTGALFTNYYLAMGGRDLAGLEVTHVSLTDAPPTEVTWKVISDWAKEHNPDSRNIHAGFNTALKGKFAHPPYTAGLPERDTIKVKYIDDLGEPQETELPWVGVSKLDQPISNLEELCPLASSADSFSSPPEQLIPEWKSAPPTVRRGNAGDLVPIFKSNYVEAYRSPSHGTGLLRILGFSQTAQLFLEDLRSIFMNFMLNGIKTLVIDVRGNGGGFLISMHELIRFLFPSLAYPHYIEQSYPATEWYRQYQLHREKEEKKAANQTTAAKTTRYPDLQSRIPRWQKIETKKYPGLKGGEVEKNFTERLIAFEGDANMLYSLRHGWGIPLFQDLFNDTDLYIVTDGDCHSACSLFTKYLKDFHAATAIGIGIDPAEYAAHGLSRYDVGSATGATHTMKTVYSTIAENPDDFNTSALPPPFPRKDTHFQWTFGYSYSYAPAEKKGDKVVNPRELSQYFHNVPVDGVLQTGKWWPTPFDNTDEFLYDMVSAINAEFVGTCFPGQVQSNHACDAQIPKDSHQQWGHPCSPTTKKFDSSQCVFSRCETNYFRNANSPAGTVECLPIPGAFPTPPPEPTDPKTEAAWKQMGIPAVVGVCALLVGVALTLFFTGCFCAWCQCLRCLPGFGACHGGRKEAEAGYMKQGLLGGASE